MSINNDLYLEMVHVWNLFRYCFLQNVNRFNHLRLNGNDNLFGCT